MRITHCVVREFPIGVFPEVFGNKKYCMDFAKRAAKPNLKVFKCVPIVEWDKHGNKKMEAQSDPKHKRAVGLGGVFGVAGGAWRGGGMDWPVRATGNVKQTKNGGAK